MPIPGTGFQGKTIRKSPSKQDEFSEQVPLPKKNLSQLLMEKIRAVIKTGRKSQKTDHSAKKGGLRPKKGVIL